MAIPGPGSAEERRAALWALAPRAAETDATARWIAVAALGPLCAHADADAVAALRRCLRDGSESVASEAARWLAERAPGDAALRAELLAVAQGPAAAPRRAALRALAGCLSSLGEDDQDALRAALRAQLGDADDACDDGSMRAEALVALWPRACAQGPWQELLAAQAATLAGEPAEIATAALAQLCVRVRGETPGLRACRRVVLAQLAADPDGHAEAAQTLAPLLIDDAELRRALLERQRRTRVPVPAVLAAVLTALAARPDAPELLAQARYAVGALLALGEHADQGLRGAAVAALAPALREALALPFGDELRAAVRALLRARLLDESTEVRHQAGAALAERAASDAALRAELWPWLGDPDARRRQAACAVLAQAAAAPDRVWAPALRAALLRLLREDPEAEVRREALRALRPLRHNRVLDAAEREAIAAAVLQALGDHTPRLRAEAVRTLGDDAALAPGVGAALRALAADPAEEVREALPQALARPLDDVPAAMMSTPPPPAWAPLLPLLDDSSRPVRNAAARSLAQALAAGQSDDHAKAKDNTLATRLWPWLAASSRETRWAVAQGFAAAAAGDLGLRARLVTALSDARWELRQGAAWALGSMTAISPDVEQGPLRALLTDRRGDRSWYRRLDAVRALADAADETLRAQARETAQRAVAAAQALASLALAANDDLLSAALATRLIFFPSG